MHKKPMFTAIALVVCALALAAIPTAAQAEAHWYVAGIKAPEGKTFPSLLWGTFTLENSNPAIPPLTCENADLGEYRNPTGGGGGEGETDLFATADCVDNECPEEAGDEVQVHSEALASEQSGDTGAPMVPVELGTKTVLVTALVSPGTAIEVGCYEAHTSTLVAQLMTCRGVSDPEFQDGSGNLSQVVSKVGFTGESDNLECATSAESGTKGVMSKSLKTMAYGSPVPTKKVGPETANTAEATLEAKNGGAAEPEEPPLVLGNGGVKVTVTKRASRRWGGCFLRTSGQVCTIEIENNEFTKNNPTTGEPEGRTLEVECGFFSCEEGLEEAIAGWFSVTKKAKSCGVIPYKGTCEVEVELTHEPGPTEINSAVYYVNLKNAAVIQHIRVLLVAY